MKLIFLDVDGVLNAPQRYVDSLKIEAKNDEEVRELLLQDRNKVIDPFHFNLEYYDNLARICKETNAKIVMSSSWRSAFKKNEHNIMSTESVLETDKILHKSYKYNKYEDERYPYFNKNAFILLVLFQERNIDFIDTTPFLKKTSSRGQEIKKWLELHQDLDIENYIIIDDETFDIKDYFDDFHIVDTEYDKGAGLTKEKTDEAIFKLNYKVESYVTVDSNTDIDNLSEDK